MVSFASVSINAKDSGRGRLDPNAIYLTRMGQVCVPRFNDQLEPQ